MLAKLTTKNQITIPKQIPSRLLIKYRKQDTLMWS